MFGIHRFFQLLVFETIAERLLILFPSSPNYRSGIDLLEKLTDMQLVKHAHLHTTSELNHGIRHEELIAIKSSIAID